MPALRRESKPFAPPIQSSSIRSGPVGNPIEPAWRDGLSRLIRPAVVLAVILGASTPVWAQPEQDDRAAEETGIEFQPRLGEFHYEIRWGFTRVARGTVTIQRENDHYILKADQQTTAFIDRLYRVRYRGETRIAAADLSPVESRIEEEIKTRRKVQAAQYDSRSGAVQVVETRSGENRPAVETTSYELRSDSGILDVFSAIFLARSFDWQVGERHEFLIFVGPKQYRVNLDCVGRSHYALGGEDIPVWVIRPGVRSATGDQDYPMHRRTRVYISADASKNIVKVKTEPGIGTVKLRLVKYDAK